MADPKQPGQTPFDPEPEEEEDVLFKAQMWVYDKFMAYWKQGLYIVGAGLVIALGYDLWTSYGTGVAEDGSAMIADVDRRMPEPDQLAQLGLAPLDDLNDPQRVATLESGAAKYEEAGKATRGVTSAEAWIKAADTWLRLNKDAEAKAAFEAAIKAHGVDIVGFAARSGLAAMQEEAGDVPGAVATLRAFADLDKGFLGEKALIEIAGIHERAGDDAAAKAIVDELRTRYPNSPRVTSLAARLGASPVAPTPAPAEG
ncbi:MAG: hypothetical protein H6741_03760 [Alphaproteobacteria bacterium]|nr:hypothetical protein [Alphaproteobacteria bacterium]